MFDIPTFDPGYEPYAIWTGGFTPEEIDSIVATGELAEFSKGRVGTDERQPGGTMNQTVRDTDITWLQPSRETEWLYDRMRGIASHVNYDKFRFDLAAFQPFQYGKYKVGGHYDWHVDSASESREHRKLTFVVGLSDPGSYTGGDLLLNLGGNQDNAHAIRLQRGDVIAFPAWTPHKVTPVTQGERLSLVGWACGPAVR